MSRGNYGIVNLLKGARVQEKGAGQNKWGSGSGSSSDSRAGFYRVRWCVRRIRSPAKGRNLSFVLISMASGTLPPSRHSNARAAEGQGLFYARGSRRVGAAGHRPQQGSGTEEEPERTNVFSRVRHANRQDPADVNRHRPARWTHSSAHAAGCRSEATASRGIKRPASAEETGLQDRCLAMVTAGPPMLPYW